ncbi:unnamed protein product [Vitrella brassicaformis CCMP3155]|uniref:Uncharacterized protein n=1 Tax=Vitrella brassicaformis (strain CCMP3155) TaxID=1169540 RepID=A0A0G4FUP6_VITBC|nr:unnamed protein product [Vitrella brassicaformis CCMP3155]|eukprot:CEM18670.1 unnamed protein product [Vitrella brassicaformis CCMP3155]
MAEWLALACARHCSQLLRRPQWMQRCQDVHFPMLQRLKPCLPLYNVVLNAVDEKDFKTHGFVVNEKAEAALGEFFLCCALTLRPKEIEAAGDDNEQLLRVSRRVAEEDVEPWIADVQRFVSEDARGASRLATVIEELERRKAHGNPLDTANRHYWHESFSAVAPESFQILVECSQQRHDTQSSGVDGSDEARLLERCTEDVRRCEEAAMQTYGAWLEASGAPLKRDLRDALRQYGLLVTKEEMVPDDDDVPTKGS